MAKLVTRESVVFPSLSGDPQLWTAQMVQMEILACDSTILELESEIHEDLHKVKRSPQSPNETQNIFR